MSDLQRRLKQLAVCVTAALATAGSGSARAAVKLPPVISSHMVLQRDMPVPIWGTAAAGERVIVTFRDQRKETNADPQGKWMVRLDPLQPGGPDVLVVNGLSLEDVLVGEVWVGSGQSNMAWTVNMKDLQNDAVLAANAAATHPRLRLSSATHGRPGEVSDATMNAACSGIRARI